MTLSSEPFQENAPGIKEDPEKAVDAFIAELDEETLMLRLSNREKAAKLGWEVPESSRCDNETKEQLQARLAAEKALLDKHVEGTGIYYSKDFLQESIIDGQDKLAQILATEAEQRVHDIDSGTLHLRDDKGNLVEKELGNEEKKVLKQEALDQQKSISERTKALLDTDTQAPYEFNLAFSMTMSAAVEAAPQIVERTFKPDLTNPISTFSVFCHFIPVGGHVAAKAISSFAKAAIKYNLDKEMSKLCNGFHPNTAHVVLAELGLSVTYAVKDQISADNPSIKTSVKKYMDAIGKILKGESTFYNTEAKVLGHVCAQKVLEAIYSEAVPVKPIKTFEDRLTQWSMDNLCRAEGPVKAASDFSDSVSDALLGESQGACCTIS